MSVGRIIYHNPSSTPLAARSSRTEVIVLELTPQVTIFIISIFCRHLKSTGSDIDTLVVAPRHVTRDDFFEHMPSILERMLPPGAIEELKPVPEAYVPIIKLVISGTDFDLNFTRLAVSTVPGNLDVKDTNLLRGLDDRELRALNGPRVADELMQLVPQNKTFRTALRAIKLWAQSSTFSYLVQKRCTDG